MSDDTPAPAGDSAGADNTSRRHALLDTPPPEAKEMDALLQSGLQAHNTIGFLTFVGIIAIGLGMLYWRSDRVSGDIPYANTIDQQVRDQAEKDMRSYLADEQVYYPDWPIEMYQKLRDELFSVALVTLLLALLFIHIERARMRRSDVLVYRALGREIEKLRLRIKKLEGAEQSGGEDATAEEESA